MLVSQRVISHPYSDYQDLRLAGRAPQGCVDYRSPYGAGAVQMIVLGHDLGLLQQVAKVEALVCEVTLVSGLSHLAWDRGEGCSALWLPALPRQPLLWPAVQLALPPSLPVAATPALAVRS